MNNWFAVDKTGLQKIQNEKNKFFIIKELVSNSFDEKITKCEVTIKKSSKHPNYIEIDVYDDSKEGFKDLNDSYTLFANSYKKGNFEQRGRFNIGEKFALSMFKSASITSTKGRVIFKDNGTRSKTNTKIPVGTLFSGLIKMNQTEMLELINQSKNIIPPKDVKFIMSHNDIDRPNVFKSFVEELPSITEDENGNLVRTKRKTNIELFKTENHFIYELGIPVVETDIGFSINVNQKIPLNKDRDNVSPSYLYKLKTYVLNHTAQELDDEEAKASWVSEALEEADTEAVVAIVESRHPEGVTFDPNDHEANKKAFADGRDVVTGGTFNSKTWNNIRNARDEFPEFMKPSGSFGKYASPNMGGNVPAPLLDKSKITKEMKQVISLAKRLHMKLFKQELNVEIFDCKGLGGNSFLATYCKGTHGSDLSFYYRTLGKNWFDLKINKLEIMRLIIHEFGHWYSSDHLSREYYKGLCWIGAKLYCNK
tara:strand:+ start:1292 stop:2734 length:1443 start_codon:yes stop_codon:yes gene_type:complete